jgi:hypothetical protein
MTPMKNLQKGLTSRGFDIGTSYDTSSLSIIPMYNSVPSGYYVSGTRFGQLLYRNAVPLRYDLTRTQIRPSDYKTVEKS